MTKITDQDLKLLSKKINLSIEKTAVLLNDNDSDTNLIIEQIAPKCSLEEIQSLSYPLNYLTFLLTNAKNKNSKEIAYIIKTIETNLPIILSKRKLSKLLINYNNNEKAAKHNLVMCGLLYTEYDSRHLVTMELGFKNTPIGSKDILFWIKLLNKTDFLRKKQLDEIIKNV
jgi:hypothetical protein